MKPFVSSLVALATALGFAVAANDGSAAPTPTVVVQPADVASAEIVSGVYRQTDTFKFEKAQFFWGGENYCWYLDGWHGPGWYWCGYAWHRGYGWGGPYGWHGWRNGGYHGGYGYHGWGGHPGGWGGHPGGWGGHPGGWGHHH